jgi:protein tyrosine/serine phosphatase
LLRAFFNRIHEKERDFSRSFGKDISTPRARRQAKWHFYLSDHGILRGLWTNLFQIGPGVWRSNQPSKARLRRYKRMGIKTVLNLRGEDIFSFYLFEREACAELGLDLIDLKIYARALVSREQFMKLFEIFDRIEKPFVMHCKSGADRAGLVSALWLLDKQSASVDEAKAMLALKYMHIKRTKTGLMDHLLEVYEETGDGMAVRDWFATRYDPKEITASFHAKMGWPAPEAA